VGASAAALSGGGGTSYTASKGGVTAITRAIAFQHAAEGIRCNSICPGPVDTPMLQISMKKLGLTTMTSRPGTIPRIAQPGLSAAAERKLTLRTPHLGVVE